VRRDTAVERGRGVRPGDNEHDNEHDNDNDSDLFVAFDINTHLSR